MSQSSIDIAWDSSCLAISVYWCSFCSLLSDEVRILLNQFV